MPNINEFIGPTPEKVYKTELEKIIGTKPCAKCDLDVEEAFWNPLDFTMTWTCASGHDNIIRINQ